MVSPQFDLEGPHLTESVDAEPEYRKAKCIFHVLCMSGSVNTSSVGILRLGRRTAGLLAGAATDRPRWAFRSTCGQACTHTRHSRRLGTDYPPSRPHFCCPVLAVSLLLSYAEAFGLHLNKELNFLETDKNASHLLWEIPQTPTLTHVPHTHTLAHTGRTEYSWQRLAFRWHASPRHLSHWYHVCQIKSRGMFSKPPLGGIS